MSSVNYSCSFIY